MKKSKELILLAIVILAAVVGGYKLRNNRYNQVPFPGESMDEYSNAWVGLSLIRLGYPIGISGLRGYLHNDWAYVNVDRVYQGKAMGNALPINHPWFDHPPAMGLISGGFAYIKGARVFEDATTATIRKPVILMSVATLGLTGILAYLVFGWKTAVLATLIYATSPLMVINSRMVQAENGMTPLMLISLIALWLYRKKGKLGFLMAAGLAAGAAMLFKISGVSIVAAGGLILLFDKTKTNKEKWLEATFFGVIAGSIALWYAVFGAAIDWQTFVAVFKSNSGRAYGIGINAISALITGTKVTNMKYLSDGWPLVGWLGLLLVLVKARTKWAGIYIWLPVVSYLMVFLFFGSDPYGWYYIPFMPFLIIIAARMAGRVFEHSREMLISALALLIPLGINLDRINQEEAIALMAPGWRILIVVSLWLGMLLAGQKRPPKWLKLLGRAIVIGLIIAAIWSNIYVDGMFTVDYWYKSY